MRLSYAPITLLQFFLITFLTLSLKPGARAQSMLAVNSSRYHFDPGSPDNDHSESIPDKYVVSVLNKGYSSAVNFQHIPMPILPARGAGRVYTRYYPLHVRIYSASIQNRMRVTIKLFKVIIVPLWCARVSK
jgi:hypothetical protein